jgi:cysteine desulfurase
MEPSHVLSAMGVEQEWARGAVRLTLGRTTTAADTARAADVIVAAVRRIRAHAAAPRSAAVTP